MDRRRDQVLALRAAELAQANPEASPAGPARAAVEEIDRLDRMGLLGEAWQGYVDRYPSLGGL